MYKAPDNWDQELVVAFGTGRRTSSPVTNFVAYLVLIFHSFIETEIEGSLQKAPSAFLRFFFSRRIKTREHYPLFNPLFKT
jgi:hypothetical protein